MEVKNKSDRLELIARVLKSKGREADISQVRNQVEWLCYAFPLYPTYALEK